VKSSQGTLAVTVYLPSTPGLRTIEYIHRTLLKHHLTWNSITLCLHDCRLGYRFCGKSSTCRRDKQSNWSSNNPAARMVLLICAVYPPDHDSYTTLLIWKGYTPVQLYFLPVDVDDLHDTILFELWCVRVRFGSLIPNSLPRNCSQAWKRAKASQGNHGDLGLTMDEIQH